MKQVHLEEAFESKSNALEARRDIESDEGYVATLWPRQLWNSLVAPFSLDLIQFSYLRL